MCARARPSHEGRARAMGDRQDRKPARRLKWRELPVAWIDRPRKRGRGGSARKHVKRGGHIRVRCSKGKGERRAGARFRWLRRRGAASGTVRISQANRRGRGGRVLPLAGAGPRRSGRGGGTGWARGGVGQPARTRREHSAQGLSRRKWPPPNPALPRGASPRGAPSRVVAAAP